MCSVQVRLGEYDAESLQDCSLIAGERVCAPQAVDVDVEEVIRHPDYSDNPRSDNYLQNDIALLRLRSSVKFTRKFGVRGSLPAWRLALRDRSAMTKRKFRVSPTEAVKPICLPETTTRQNLDGKKAVVAGWGKDRNRGCKYPRAQDGHVPNTHLL